MHLDLAQPCLLVATRLLQDPNFRQTVVLIIEDTKEGSLGFILNRPIPVPLKELILAPGCPVPPDVPAWTGGPLGKEFGVILQDESFKPQEESTKTPQNSDPRDQLRTNSKEALARFKVRASKESLASLAESALDRQSKLAKGLALIGPLYPFRFLIGYAGWSKGQLRDEIASGAWLKTPATSDLVFGTHWSKLWRVAGDVAAFAGHYPGAQGVLH